MSELRPEYSVNYVRLMADSYRVRLVVAALGYRLQNGALGEPAILPVGLERGKVVDRGKLNEGRRHEGKAYGDEPVHGSGVGDFGQRGAGADA